MTAFSTYPVSYHSDEPADDHISIRGAKLALGQLVSPLLDDPDYVAELRHRFQVAKPFGHVVLEGLFNECFLELIHEEFDLFRTDKWKSVVGQRENFVRSTPGTRQGPATQLYFSLVNSGWFADFLEAVTGIEDLIPDPHLEGGGLHETRPGGKFGVHRDFTRHFRNGLDNEMIFITYLNRNWDPAYHGDLQLWDRRTKKCVERIFPEFGRSLIMKQGAQAYHGHPAPLQAPEGMTRRSVASYYYSYRAKMAYEPRVTTRFLFVSRKERINAALRQVTPPILWRGLKALTRR